MAHPKFIRLCRQVLDLFIGLGPSLCNAERFEYRVPIKALRVQPTTSWPRSDHPTTRGLYYKTLLIDLREI